MSGLTIRDVHKSYGSVEVLKGINIDVAEGEFLILVGSSGCGKSTLLNMIAGLETITQGDIAIGGKIVNDLPPKHRDIAMVFQSYALYPSMTVRENISFGLEIRKVSTKDRERIVDGVANSLRISHLLDRKPRQLSGGQRQRVAMGRALARDPTLFLFDEPLSNLDAQLRIEMRAEIKLLHQRTGKTICYVTHDQVEAMTLGDRIAVMKDGTVQQLAPPQEIYDFPANMYVASFIGAPPMNFVPGRIEVHGDGLGLRVDAGGQQTLLKLPFNPAAVKGTTENDVFLGIRPERLTRTASGGAPSRLVQQVPVQIDFTEPTGPDTLLHASINGRRVLCRVEPAQAPRAGETLLLDFDLSHALLFDAKTGERIDGRTPHQAALAERTVLPMRGAG